jgi:acetyl esterase/lipase
MDRTGRRPERPRPGRDLLPRGRLLERPRRLGPAGHGAARARPRLPGRRARLPTLTPVPVLADARDLGLAVPACGICNSLWADIALNTPSLDDPVRNRFDIRRELVEGLSRTFLSPGGIDPFDGRHSPVYRDLTGLPPLLVQAAGRDVCHDDSIRLAASARASGVAVTITEYPDAEHIWILNGPWRLAYGERYPDDGVRWIDSGAEAPEAITAVEEMVAFIRRHTTR